ncbi:hypothetical protein FNV43_RR05107 [Rhamnella rubrinervis]|uniref:non-specific serine/threonine protein kinase n=1 Tax=Rhamnella rubrinervis TaxID=2594499 RepID=A0A8K0HM20_9ROSA|nr:hypothetical protein FNV43_RR05107 [Rhamnella rubrinervis]
MGSSLRTLFFLTILFRTHFSLAEDENQFIYNGFNGSNFHVDGVAKIHPNGLLQLTNSSKIKMGHAFYKVPISFNSSSSALIPFPSFSTNIVFAIVPEDPNLSGHGMAFTISPSMDFNQAVESQYLGLFNISNNGLSTNHVLAIELDTIENTEFEDIDDNHVGIDVNSLKSFESAPATYFSDEQGKNISLKLLSGDPMQLWIDYDAPQKILNVTVAPKRSQKPNRPLLSTPIDLSQVLLDTMYLGFSAATGSVASDHYVLGWSFNKSGPAQSLELSKLPPLPPRRKRSQKPSKIVIVAPVVAIFVLVVVIGAVYFIRRKKYEEVREEWESEYGPQRFSYKNLYIATNGFKEKELLGAGGFGKVYRGTLPNSDVHIAVKRISHDSRQGMKEFVAEIASMRRLRHRNLVQLLGYCRRKGELLLVYDYMPNGSLDKSLFNNKTPNLSWFHRFRVLRDVASALLYLHEGWEQVVLHRDVKSSNVLLDADFNGRLGDFGLARLYDHGTNLQTTHVVGTVGYLAPELTKTGKATTRTDVFAFGAFMLEVACGKKPIFQGQYEEVILVEWVMECWKGGRILDASDPKLESDYVTEEMELVLKLGMLCSHSVSAMRPNMRQVTQYLDGSASLPEIEADISVSMSTFTTSNEASETAMSFPASVGNCSAHFLSSNESILHKGR